MKQSRYTSRDPDTSGYVHYTDDEQRVWKTLFDRQMPLLKKRACQEYLDGLNTLGITGEQIPQIPDVNEKLRACSGWEIAPVPALINFQHFFELMADKKFPAATFIRVPEELDYIQEPDIFHEIFGHCPLISLPMYADFMFEYAKLGLEANKADRAMLARLYWFTVEFGLIQTKQGMKIYGGGILSSPGESKYCLDSDKPITKKLDPIEAFRTPYRIDILQPVYFVIQDFNDLFTLSNTDLIEKIHEARELGMHRPLFETLPPKGERFL